MSMNTAAGFGDDKAGKEELEQDILNNVLHECSWNGFLSPLKKKLNCRCWMKCHTVVTFSTELGAI